MLQKHVNKAVKRLLFRSMIYRLRYLLNSCYILPYHMISIQPNGFFPEDSLNDFVRAIKYLKQNYHVISLEEIAIRISLAKSVRGCAAITFDDGFRDNYENAYPILRQYQIPATIFLTAGYIENGDAPWFIKLRYAFMRTANASIEIELGGKLVRLSLCDDSAKRSSSDRLMTYLQTCPNEERLSLLQTLPSLLGVSLEKDPHSLMLTWDQIIEMSHSGISFGAHTMTHPILSRVSFEIMRSEIQSSKTLIEQKIGRNVNTFAYPFGRKAHYPNKAPNLLKDLHFLCAVTTEPGTNSFHTSPFELKRSRPWELSFA